MGDKIKDIGLQRVPSMTKVRNAYIFARNIKGRYYFQDLDTDGMITLEWILIILGVEWNDQDQWRALTNTIIKN